MRPGGTDTLVFEINMGRSAESFFELISPHKRGAAIIGVLLENRLGNINPLMGGIELLIGALLAKNRIEV